MNATTLDLLLALAKAAVRWWKDHEHDAVILEASDGYADEFNVFNEKPEFVTLAEQVLNSTKNGEE